MIFIHVDELGRQIAACVLQSEVTGVINCCTGTPITLAEKRGAVHPGERNENPTPIRARIPTRPYDSPGVWGDAAKIRAILEKGRKSDE